MKVSKKLKGFTLLELIIVIALFTIIMAAVMTLIDPVSKVMSKASIQEKNSSSVNVIKDYLEGSMKYSAFLTAYTGEFNDKVFNGKKIADEEDAVEDFVDTYFDSRIDSNKDLAKGKVRVIEIDNTDGGKIYESVYNFTAGDSYEDSSGDIVQINKPKVKLEEDASGNPIHRTQAVNNNYYTDYSFYFDFGLKDTETIDAATYGLTPDNSAKTYYGRLVDRIDPSTVTSSNPDGSPYVSPDKLSQSMFAISIVTYKNDGAHRFDGPFTIGGTAIDGPVFKSPFYLSTSSMAFVNMINANEFSKYIYNYFILERDDTGAETGKIVRKYSSTGTGTPPSAPPLLQQRDNGNTEKIYFVYALPSEIES